MHEFRFSDSYRHVVQRAQQDATSRQARHVHTEHLLHAMLADETNAACMILKSCAVDLFELRTRVADRVASLPRSDTEKKVMFFGSMSKRVLDRAVGEAQSSWHSTQVGTEHLLLAILRDESREVDDLLAASNVQRVLVREEFERFMRTGAAFEPLTPGPRATHLKLEVRFDNGTVAHHEFNNVALVYQYLGQLR